MGTNSQIKLPMNDEIRIPSRKFSFQFTDLGTGALLFGGAPVVLEKIHHCLYVYGWQVISGTVSEDNEWTLCVQINAEDTHNFVFGAEIAQVILPDSAIFDKVYQMVSQVVQMSLHKKFAEIRKGMLSQ